jgi:hypothetical protein
MTPAQPAGHPGPRTTTPDTPPAPVNPVVAYCAPGLRGYAIRLLETNGDQVREVIEHPWMTGRTDVIIAVGALSDSGPAPAAQDHP